MMVVLSSFLLILFTLSSCEEDTVRPCPDSWICDEFNNPYINEIYIEGLIEGDKFIPQSVRYCSTHDSEIEKRPKSKGIDNLKVRVYYWDNSIDFEKDIYLMKDEQASGNKHVIMHLPDSISYGKIIRVVELNEKKEEIKILAEIKQQDIPEEKGNKPYSKAYYCKNQPFVLTSESNKAEDSL